MLLLISTGVSILPHARHLKYTWSLSALQNTTTSCLHKLQTTQPL